VIIQSPLLLKIPQAVGASPFKDRAERMSSGIDGVCGYWAQLGRTPKAWVGLEFGSGLVCTSVLGRAELGRGWIPPGASV
jgi:hypothetical protein